MDEGVRVTVAADGEERSVRVHDDAGEVSAGDATVSFSVSGTPSRDDGTSDDHDGTDDRDPRFVAPLAAVPSEGTMRCEALEDGYGVGIILRQEGEEVLAWRNSCPHKPEVPLDPGDGAIVTDTHLVCHEHGARFERGEGTCTHGPCAGERLDPIDVTVRDGDVYLVDERFEACRRL